MFPRPPVRELLLPTSKGDTLIDGGNSNYKDSMRRAAMLQTKGIEFVDAGTSGGIWGLKEGYSMMIGGEKPAVDRLRPIFETLAPSRTAAGATWDRTAPDTSSRWCTTASNTE